MTIKANAIVGIRTKTLNLIPMRAPSKVDNKARVDIGDSYPTYCDSTG
jgi:hypothetical protein